MLEQAGEVVVMEVVEAMMIPEEMPEVPWHALHTCTMAWVMDDPRGDARGTIDVGTT